MNKQFSKILSFLMVVIMIFTMIPVNVFADSIIGQLTYEEALIGITEYIRIMDEDPSIGSVGGEWGVLGLARNKEVTLSEEYINKYYQKVEDEVIKQSSKEKRRFGDKITEVQRIILALASIGKNPNNIAGQNLYDYIWNKEGNFPGIRPNGILGGRQGANELIFGLLALDVLPNVERPEDATITREQIINILVDDYQMSDGGFSLSDDYKLFNVDITSMAVQSLAKYYDKNEKARNAIDKAIDKLSKNQDDEGEFPGEGVFASQSSEAIAQVVVALSALNIDADKDTRFIKNGTSALEALLGYYDKPTKSFKHNKSNTGVNAMASEQALYALVAYDRYKKKQNALYDMSDVELEGETGTNPGITEVYATEITIDKTEVELKVGENKSIQTIFTPEETTKRELKYKLKEENGVVSVDENGLVTALKVGTATVIIEAEKEKETDETVKAECVVNVIKEVTNPEKKQTVILSVDKLTIDMGYVINPVEVELYENDTIWDLLKRALNKNHIDYRCKYYEKYNSIYVQSIDGDGEFDHGQGSGWMYSVNGIYPQVGCSVFFPKDKDVIKWRYTTNLGFDIGGGYAVGDKTEQNETSTISITSKKKGNTNIVKLDDKSIVKILEKANKNNESTITIDIEDEIKTNELDICMTYFQLNKIKELDDAELLIKSNLMEICIPKLVLEGLAKKENNDIVIRIKKEDKIIENIVESKSENNNSIYNVSLIVNGKRLKDILSKITIKIPYDLKDNKDKKNVVVYSLNSNGRPLEIIGSRYNDAYNCAVFKTNTSKNFVVGIKDEYEPHKDIVEEEWYYTSVKYAVENKLFDGMPDGNFNPNKEMTKSMLAIVLYRLEGEPETDDKSSFSDVEEGQWYENAVVWVRNNSITEEIEEEVFGVNDVITTEQLATMLYKYAKLKGLNIENEQSLTEFSDNDLVSQDHIESVKWAVKNNIISVKPGLLLETDSNVSRAQATRIIMNFIKNIYR